MRTFRLTNEPGGLGLSCTPAGLSLAGAPLLRKTEKGFAPRPLHEVASLIEAAYGADPTRLRSSLGVIAEALNQGDFARASIAAVLARAPELSIDAAERLANLEKTLAKFDPDQPRDWHGRWTREGGASAAAPATSAKSDDKANEDQSRAAASLVEVFERKYDELGPVDFSKEVIQFGDRLGREGKDLSPAERERALAEYSFLQDRLSFWLDYDHKPALADVNLLSAALTLHQGAILGGIVRAGETPRSMLDLAGVAWAFGNAAPRLGTLKKPAAEIAPVEPIQPPRGFREGGPIVDNGEIGTVWWKGVKEQGDGWESFVGRQDQGLEQLPPNAKAFDHFNPTTREAVSAKTLNTLSVSYIKNPQSVYAKLKSYIDAAADYEPRVGSDLNSRLVSSKTIQLAIPEYTSPEQWRYLYPAILYGKERGVSIVITRIRE
jgi:hypothetical protein